MNMPLSRFSFQSFLQSSFFCQHHNHALSSVYLLNELERLRFVRLVYATAKAFLCKKCLEESSQGHFQRSQVWHKIRP